MGRKKERYRNPAFIYKFTNLINGKIYVGSTIQINTRIRQHELRSQHEDTKFYRAINKYGFGSFMFDILEECCCISVIRNEREDYWIKHYHTLCDNYGYNTHLADNTNVTEFTKNKLSGSNNPFYGKKHSDESRQKMSNSLKGKKPTEETRIKLSIARTGTKRSEETRKKMSESAKGKIRSEETLKRMSIAAKKTWETKERRPMSEEQKLKIGLAQKGKKIPPESIEKMKLGLKEYYKTHKHPLTGVTGINNPNYGKKRSDESRQRMRIAQQLSNKKRKQEQIKKNRAKVKKLF